jgi:thiol-disulfide isomerase/thioredoxin
MRLSRALAPLLVVLACATEPPLEDRLVGIWHAELESPGGPLPFALRIYRQDDYLAAVAINGAEEAPFSHVRIRGDVVELASEWYDSEIRARFDRLGNETLRGLWRKTSSDGDSILAFEATRNDLPGRPSRPRFAPVAPLQFDAGSPDPAMPDSVAGHWAIELTDEDGVEPARGELRQEGEVVTGTILTPVGDYRYLEGSYELGRLRLSTFDGAHAFLFDAEAKPDGTMAGDFWSRDSYHATWVAHRVAADERVLPDAWRLAGLTNDEGRFRFDFPDLDGDRVSLTDGRFAGKVVLVNIFGSWCPNCNDKAPLLAAWHRSFRERGLEVVGLAYELTGDVERDRRQVRRFAERHDIEFPLLLAGLSDKQKAAETLPDLSAVVAFPTTVFVGRDGRARRVHTGFAGPGTGAHHERMVLELERLIEDLLAEPAPPPTRHHSSAGKAVS